MWPRIPEEQDITTGLAMYAKVLPCDNTYSAWKRYTKHAHGRILPTSKAGSLQHQFQARGCKVKRAPQVPSFATLRGCWQNRHSGAPENGLHSVHSGTLARQLACRTCTDKPEKSRGATVAESQAHPAHLRNSHCSGPTDNRQPTAGPGVLQCYRRPGPRQSLRRVRCRSTR